jgi:hypothetical protein
MTTPKGFAVVQQESVPDWIKNAQRGSENVAMEDMVIPRLEIVQALSPAIKRGDPKQIPGAETGDLTNSVTRENYGKEVFVVPVHFSKQWLVWKEKKQGGGFFGAYPDEMSARARAEEEGGAKGGIEVVDTPQHLCLISTKNGVEEIMIPLAKTKAKVSRGWNSVIRLAGGDRFSRVYKLVTAEEKNDKGDYFNYTVQQVGFPSAELYAKAEDLYNRIAAGEKKVVMHVDEDAYEGQRAEM